MGLHKIDEIASPKSGVDGLKTDFRVPFWRTRRSGLRGFSTTDLRPGGVRTPRSESRNNLEGSGLRVSPLGCKPGGEPVDGEREEVERRSGAWLRRRKTCSITIVEKRARWSPNRGFQIAGFIGAEYVANAVRPISREWQPRG